MWPVLFTWRGVSIRSFPVAIYAAMLVGAAVAIRAAQGRGLDAERCGLAILFLSCCIFVGARAAFVALNWRRVSGNWRDIFDRKQGGMSVSGGLLLALVCSPAVLFSLHLPFADFGIRLHWACWPDCPSPSWGACCTAAAASVLRRHSGGSIFPITTASCVGAFRRSFWRWRGQPCCCCSSSDFRPLSSPALSFASRWPAIRRRGSFSIACGSRRQLPTGVLAAHCSPQRSFWSRVTWLGCWSDALQAYVDYPARVGSRNRP